jgi:hypothetical protein
MVAPGDKDFEERLDIIRFRLQGNTLRIVHEVNSEADVCDGKPHDSDSDRRSEAAVLGEATYCEFLLRRR